MSTIINNTTNQLAALIDAHPEWSDQIDTSESGGGYNGYVTYYIVPHYYRLIRQQSNNNDQFDNQLDDSP